MDRADPTTLAQLVAGRRGDADLLLLCDFDGTLCEFQADPAAVWLPADRRDLLVALTRAAGTTVGVVSGRRLDDVRLRSGLARASSFGAGLHGLEIDGPGESFVHPGLGEARVRARTIAGTLLPLVADLPGAFVEDKDLSIALHFREASLPDRERAAAAFDRAIAPALAAGAVRVMRGACVLEALPNIEWTKGHAVRWIRERLARRGRPPFVVYIGDDVTDEDAFAATRGHGLAIAASDRVTGADYRVDGPPEVERLLRALVSRSGPSAVR